MHGLTDAIDDHEVIAQTLHLGESQLSHVFRKSCIVITEISNPIMPQKKTLRSSFKQLKSHPRWVRIPLGILLILGGIFGALPILGFWMLPLGLILLSADFPWAKRALAYLKLLWRRTRNAFRQLFGKKPANNIDRPDKQPRTPQ